MPLLDDHGDEVCLVSQPLEEEKGIDGVGVLLEEGGEEVRLFAARKLDQLFRPLRAGEGREGLSRAHLDQTQHVSRLPRLQLPQLQLDSLDLTLEDRALQLEVEVQHGLRLGGEGLRFGLLGLLVMAQLVEVAISSRKGEGQTGQRRIARSKETRVTYACKLKTNSLNCPIVVS